MFDASGNYAPPDQATPHVLVATTPFTGQLQRGGKVPVVRGQVIDTATLGFTNIAAGMGPKHPHGALIEHPTAKLGDVLSEADLTAGVAAAAAKLAAVQKFWAAEKAKHAAAALEPKPAA